MDHRTRKWVLLYAISWRFIQVTWAVSLHVIAPNKPLCASRYIFEYAYVLTAAVALLQRYALTRKWNAILWSCSIRFKTKPTYLSVRLEQLQDALVVDNVSEFICRGGLGFNCNVEKKYNHTWNFIIEKSCLCYCFQNDTHIFFLAGKRSSSTSSKHYKNYWKRP